MTLNMTTGLVAAHACSSHHCRCIPGAELPSWLWDPERATYPIPPSDRRLQHLPESWRASQETM